MDLNKPFGSLTPSERTVATEHLRQAIRQDEPGRVWVEDGHVFVESHTGQLVSMAPTVAIKLGRMLTDAGSDALVNAVIDENGTTPGPPA